MKKNNPSEVSQFKLEKTTAQVMNRFIAAFQQHDATAFADLVAEDCVMETMQPAPDGTRYEGYDANLRFWQAMATDPKGSFETEDVVRRTDRKAPMQFLA